MKKLLRYAIPILIFAIGLGVVLYPTVSNLWNQHRQNKLICKYVEEVEELQEDQLADLKAAAHAYNDGMSGTALHDAFSGEQTQEDSEYESLLNLNGDGIMGYIKIPKINLQLSIYHGTNENALENGVGHLEGSSLPVGGESTHCVITGHRGLPSAKLFTDLDKLENGDIFYLYVLGETLAYEVDQTWVVEPDNVDELRIRPGEDYVTLVTCTPYGVNSHRLLVRGHRVELQPQMQEESSADTTGVNLAIVIPVAVLSVFFIVIAVIKVVKVIKKKKK
jgi:sortase A